MGGNMKRKWLATITLAAALMLAAGCGQKEEAADLAETEESQQQTEADSEEAEGANETEGTNETEGADEGEDGNGTEESQQLGDGNLFSKSNTYSWEEVTISIPDSWEGKYQVEQGEEGISLIQSASAQKEEGMGFLCGFYRTDGMVIDAPGATALAYTDTQTYYMVEPTDVCFYYEDEAISEEYHEMYDLVSSIAATIEIDKEGVKYNPDEFILPLSDTVLVRDDQLYNYSDKELAIARNEIYARHGRKFNDEYLTKYFDSCSWYEGTIMPEAFDETVLSRIEKDNLATIKKAEEAYKEEHPYPKEYSVGSKVEEDLDGDGETEQLQYVLEEADGEYKGKLVIDGQEFDLEDYEVCLVTPEEDLFYVTDISPYYDGLEIAILDYGPSYDRVTYFFTYQDELTYIGSISGFPFSYNGDANDGVVSGEIRLDFTHTCYAYSSWWYDYDKQKLEYQDTGYYRIVPEGSHQLYEDLTVYLEMNEEHLKTTIPAQEKVFFLETDGKEWVLVKGKDGTKGYMHIVDGKISGLSKEPGEVFSDLNFVD